MIKTECLSFMMVDIINIFLFLKFNKLMLQKSLQYTEISWQRVRAEQRTKLVQDNYITQIQKFSNLIEVCLKELQQLFLIQKIIIMKANQQKLNLLIGVTGSVATIKLAQLVQILKQRYNIRIVVTQHSKHFLKDFKLPENILMYEDSMEWLWKERGDPVLHIQLRKWAHCFLIAPLDAHTLAKLSQGLCDNLLSLIARCWDMTLINVVPKQIEKQLIQPSHLLNANDIQKREQTLKFPLIVCPSMNNLMYSHPITNQQLDILKKWGVTVIDPQVKTLVCGDTGIGAMASLQTISLVLQSKCKELLKRNQIQAS